MQAQEVQPGVQEELSCRQAGKTLH